MKTVLTITVTSAWLLCAGDTAHAAGLLDFLGLGKSSTNTSLAGAASAIGLSEQQISDSHPNLSRWAADFGTLVSASRRLSGFASSPLFPLDTRLRYKLPRHVEAQIEPSLHASPCVEPAAMARSTNGANRPEW